MARFEPGFVPIVDGEIVSDETARADQLGRILQLRQKGPIKFNRQTSREAARDIIREETIEDEHPRVFGVTGGLTDLLSPAVSGETVDLGGGVTSEAGPNAPANIDLDIGGIEDTVRNIAIGLVLVLAALVGLNAFAKGAGRGVTS